MRQVLYGIKQLLSSFFHTFPAFSWRIFIRLLRQRIFPPIRRILIPKAGEAWMLYVQIKNRVAVSPGEQLKVHHVADARDTDGQNVMDLPVECPKNPGVWRLPAIAVVKAVEPVCPQVTVMGPDECFVHIVPDSKRNRTRPLRTVIAFLLLMIGSALAITWFHADVNMLDAQQSIYRLVTGHDAENIWLISIPYSIGVFFGVALFYALIGKKRTTKPLEIKLEEYRQSAEQATGMTP